MPPPSYEQQRVFAQFMAAQLDDKMRSEQVQYNQAPQYYSAPQSPYQGQQTKVHQNSLIESLLSRPTSELTNILVIASVLMASSPLALLPFVPLLVLLLFPSAPAALLA